MNERVIGLLVIVFFIVAGMYVAFEIIRVHFYPLWLDRKRRNQPPKSNGHLH